ncbi:major facilitator superfamily domain-containing protein [Stachybotrys elegans]|uniref:Major facilitator superfamily domain-containing protein n=1 Tax=Stachybotrys elegans TaxID=80388 RepID=A0A8K0SHT4_9HYPO|nr:major facilitator superfamily domain-containing protein [Stachybotrys elegans]
MASVRAHSASAGKSLAWLYHESGMSSVFDTGRDAWLVILARSSRMFAFGAVSLIIALFFAELGFTDPQIGVFMTLTLLGDVVLGLVITLMADSIGRRRVLFAGGLLMVLSGAVFYYFENFWILLLAAIVGVVSANGSDVGPFRAIEESMLSHLTTPKSRADVLSWYVVNSSLGSAAGTEFSGRFIEAMRSRDAWDLRAAYHAAFWIYIAMGAANMLFAFGMSSRCEIAKPSPDAATEAAQGLLHDQEQDDDDDDDDDDRPAAAQPKATKSRFSSVSSATRSIMYKLWFLLAFDSLADGMVSHTLTNYYLDRKFHMAKSTLGDIISTSHILATISALFAGPLARHIGLVNTMVFTHLPSSAAVLLFPIPSGVVLTIILLFIRHGLNNMDQAPRAAFIAAVVKPEERTAVMGITSTMRTLASTIGPTLTGALAGSDYFWVAFVVAGTLRILYDLGLWAMFINMKLHSHETAPQNPEEARESVDEPAELPTLEEHGEARRREDV